VPYAPGELKAIALKNGKTVATKILHTTGEPAAIDLVVDRLVIRADRQDLAFVAINIIDKNGHIVPNAATQINLSVKGAGELVAAGSAHPYDMASFQQPECKTFRGKALAIIRSTLKAGDIEFTATADGLEKATVIIQSQ